MKNLLEEKNINRAIKNNEGFTEVQVAEIAAKNEDSIKSNKHTITANHLKQTKERLNDHAKELMIVMNNNNSALDDALNRSKKKVSQAKDMANQLSEQLLRVNKILGVDFESRVLQLERVTACLVSLEKLSKDEKLKEILSVLGNK